MTPEQKLFMLETRIRLYCGIEMPHEHYRLYSDMFMTTPGGLVATLPFSSVLFAAEQVRDPMP